MDFGLKLISLRMIVAGSGMLIVIGEVMVNIEVNLPIE